jgi:hypothetical protein
VGSNGTFDFGCIERKAGLYIGGDRHLDGAADSGDSFKHLRPGNVLTVRETKGVGHGGAAGGHGRKSAMLDHGRAGGVPAVDQHQRLRAMMQLKQPRSFLRGGNLVERLVFESHGRGSHMLEAIYFEVSACSAGDDSRKFSRPAPGCEC